MKMMRDCKRMDWIESLGEGNDCVWSEQNGGMEEGAQIQRVRGFVS